MTNVATLEAEKGVAETRVCQFGVFVGAICKIDAIDAISIETHGGIIARYLAYNLHPRRKVGYNDIS